MTEPDLIESLTEAILISGSLGAPPRPVVYETIRKSAPTVGMAVADRLRRVAAAVAGGARSTEGGDLAAEVEIARSFPGTTTSAVRDVRHLAGTVGRAAGVFGTGKNIIGERFGRLTVIGMAPAALERRSSKRLIWWRCSCDCGNEHVAPGVDLRRGNVKSCGCLQQEHAVAQAKINTRHGHARAENSPTYSSWLNMWRRVRATTGRYARLYGGRGVTVCARWEKFENFLADMGERPTGKSLDRYPNRDGNYESGNCRWATQREQCNNQRTNRRITMGGETRTVTEWSRLNGISVTAITKRLRKGWSPERAVTEPPSRGRAQIGPMCAEGV